jgi:tRNA A37 threonylcarbamoyladenosine dehydratase
MEQMNPHENQPRKIDVLELSDTEKKQLINAVRAALRDTIEEAKFWRTLAESEEVIVNGKSIAL